ncbi:hypothetical protein SAMN04488128_101210 [Chitinophaga eiseniae]|uniref:Uncharacterized protein n=2 Tax=Chitinophaga eiseniae TaxID=634771 RepID=A0A1T4KME4_9BACT|nr:hypothetical protein SAMN04488128_101210 [Chitinophaga eiseniae]
MQVDDVIYAARGFKTFKASRSLKFSETHNVNLDSLEIAAVRFRESFPANYWAKPVQTILLDTKPNEDGQIWLESVFTETDSRKKLKAVAAIMVRFAETDLQQARLNPQIQEITIITDPTALKKHPAVIQRLKKIYNIQPLSKKEEMDIPPPPPLPSDPIKG